MPDVGLLNDLLFAEPAKDATGWSAENEQGSYLTFGPDVVSRFLQKQDMDLIVRSKQVVMDGFEFFAERKLVTLFTAPNFKGKYDNAGAIMSIDESLLVTFQVCDRRCVVLGCCLRRCSETDNVGTSLDS